MDMHIAPHPEAGDRPAPLRARLPREPLEAEEQDSAEAAVLGAASARERLVNVPTQRRKRRRSLLLGVSVVAIGVAGGCAFLVSPYNRVVS